ncbi:hypothetical protein SALBM135S_03720 [Streptomyces alboniger]
MPVSWCSTPLTAPRVMGTKPMPRPSAVTNMAGIRCPAYDESGVSVANQNMPMAATSSPGPAISRGARRVISLELRVAAMPMPRLNGRLAKPVLTAL